MSNNWLDENFTGYNAVHGAGVPVPQRKTLNFGSGLTVGDDPTNGVTTITGTGSAPLLVTALVTTPPINPSVQEFYIASAYSTPGDGGGGTFVWNPTDIRAADGGTIIAVSGIATGRWNRVYSGALNLLWWGADRTGSSYNDAAWAAMIAAKEAQSGAVECEIPAGYYLFHHAIDTASKACIIRGHGTGFHGAGDFVSPANSHGTTLAFDSTTEHGLTIGNAASTIVQVGITIRDLAVVNTLWANGAPFTVGTTGTGIFIRPTNATSPTSIQIENVYVAGWAVGFNPGAVQEARYSKLVCWSNVDGLRADMGAIDGSYFQCEFNGNINGIHLISVAEQRFFGGLCQSNYFRGFWIQPNSTVYLCVWNGIHLENNNSGAGVSDASGTATTIAAGSDTAVLPQATIHVVSTAGLTSPVTVVTDAGPQIVTFSGTSGGNALTGCVGGIGEMHTGNTVAHGAAYGDVVYDLTCEKVGTVSEIDHLKWESCWISSGGAQPFAFLRNTSGTNASSYVQFILKDIYGPSMSLSIPTYSILSEIRNCQLGGSLTDAGVCTSLENNRFSGAPASTCINVSDLGADPTNGQFGGGQLYNVGGSLRWRDDSGVIHQVHGKTGTVVVSIGAIGPGATTEFNISVGGATTGMDCVAVPNGDPGAGLVWCCRAGTDIVTVRLANVTLAPITPTAAQTWQGVIRKLP